MLVQTEMEIDSRAHTRIRRRTGCENEHASEQTENRLTVVFHGNKVLFFRAAIKFRRRSRDVRTQRRPAEQYFCERKCFRLRWALIRFYCACASPCPSFGRQKNGFFVIRVRFIFLESSPSNVPRFYSLFPVPTIFSSGVLNKTLLEHTNYSFRCCFNILITNGVGKD